MQKIKYKFRIKTTSVSFGVVTAETEDEAIELINNEEWDDIIDMYQMEYGNIISIEES